eukprot:12463883-Ditylum_brightwellii.AAC.1
MLMQCIIPNLTYSGMWGSFIGGEFLLALLRDAYPVIFGTCFKCVPAPVKSPDTWAGTRVTPKSKTKN